MFYFVWLSFQKGLITSENAVFELVSKDCDTET